MNRRRGGKLAPPRVCAYCGAPLAENRPVWLVGTPSGKILGPFHAGCSARLSLIHKGKETAEDVKAASFGQIVPGVEHEELPW